jgi:hypothetical protein
MAISEQAPRPQHRERQQPPDAAAIASRVAGAVDNLQRDREKIPNPFELCRRSDMAMVAMLEIVAPVLPEIVRDQVNKLISIHDEFYQAATPSAEHQMPEHEQ